MSEGATFPLVAAVEALHAERYVVLGPENAEETAVLLGGIVHGEEIENAAQRASDVLAAFPKEFGEG